MSNVQVLAYPAAMILPRHSQFSRLRRHRGLWLLVAAVLLIKLVAGTACLADRSTPGVSYADGVPVVTVAQIAGDDTLATDDSTCLLGEAGDCHCTCAHTATLPATSCFAMSRLDARFDAPMALTGYRPAALHADIRPPIA